MSKEPNKRLFVGALPFKYTEGELVTLFAPFGRITALRIIHNQWGKSRGMGYVEYDELQSAINAQHELHNFAVESDRTIIVDFAKPDPYLTPEGAARHIAALAEKKKKRPTTNFIAPKPTSVGEDEKPIFHPKSFYEHQRPTVFKSRNFHAKIGAKFSSRTKTKTTR